VKELEKFQSDDKKRSDLKAALKGEKGNGKKGQKGKGKGGVDTIEEGKVDVFNLGKSQGNKADGNETPWWREGKDSEGLDVDITNAHGHAASAKAKAKSQAASDKKHQQRTQAAGNW
jgi:hypothetical protein